MKTITEQLPCIGCLLIPVCRHKTFGTLLIECELAKEYFDSDDQERNAQDYFMGIIELEAVLNPTAWKYRGRAYKKEDILWNY